MAAPDWSSLPADLVNRVADCLLATNDLDCYADLRAVCHLWRSVTADPGSNQHDPRFRPSRWLMLDEPKVVLSTITDGPFHFVNTASGRFVRRSPALLRNRGYVFITSTAGGLLILAGRDDPPHAVVVLNPFTGSMISFAAQLPTEPSAFTADVVGSTPTLVLVSVTSNEVYWADPQSGSFSDEMHRNCPASRLPQIADAINRESVPGAKNIFDQLRSVVDDAYRCYAVVAASGEMLAVLKRPNGIDVFKMDAAGNVMEERVNSIGSQALFLGVRYLAVNTDCFPTFEANCAYLRLTGLYESQFYIYKYRIGIYIHEEEPELVSTAPMSNMGPLTLTQFFCNYTMDIPGHPLTWEMCISNAIMLGSCDNYMDYVNDKSDGEDYGYQPYGEDYSDSEYQSDDDDYYSDPEYQSYGYEYL